MTMSLVVLELINNFCLDSNISKVLNYFNICVILCYNVYVREVCDEKLVWVI